MTSTQELAAVFVKGVTPSLLGGCTPEQKKKRDDNI